MSVPVWSNKRGAEKPIFSLIYLPDRLRYSDRISMRICHHPKGLVLLLLYCLWSLLSWMGSNEKRKMTLHLGRKRNDSCAFSSEDNLWKLEAVVSILTNHPQRSLLAEPKAWCDLHGSAPISHLQHCQVEKPGLTDCKTRWHHLIQPSV